MSILRIGNDGKERIKDRVLVLLSSYNGEKYIREQLDSLLSQTMPVFILIRDDGSRDSTVSIIREYMERHDNIRLIEGENLGFVGSFNALICNELTDEYEWSAFCDQDDVWLPEKLSAAVSMMKKDYDPEIPTVYCSNLTVTDSELNPSGLAYDESISADKDPILYNYISGCASLINHAAAVIYREGINPGIYAHDKQIHCICYYLGRIIYDENSYILYRQHGSNTIGYSKSKPFLQGVRDVISDVFVPKGGHRWAAHFRGFSEAYDKYLSEDERKHLKLFVDHEHSLPARVRIFFSPRFRAKTFIDTLAFKVRVLVNRLY
ncbi:MAG: glycosyltransferase [Oscillospiraceae bacterium]|nr:glycosyltransferase [Oscillospiraceae bacterium]